jgi:hypothetical protein
MVRRMILVGHSYVKRLQNFCDSYLYNFGFSDRDADVFYVALGGATLIEGLTCRRMYLSDVAALNPYLFYLFIMRIVHMRKHAYREKIK